MRQRSKNIRAAIRARADAIDVARVAAKYCADANRQAVDEVLDEDAVAFAHSALLVGDALEIVGDSGPCLDRAQRRAWAAGRLLSILQSIRRTYALLDERKGTAATIAKLEREVEHWRTSAQAAWRASGMDKVVPFRDPKHSYHGTPEWAA
ncbi:MULTISPECIES: hypothetical protein [unclassified Mesorhizobium]|uniref:hypothetical protein n=1 Tax=unclassified Mesorhizobium TaxID=325217 RepID=UPI001092BD87|nr:MULTISPECIES: hypothetical protein [unclassified Mesorhizobium]TGP88922.1 hypothetical protein EN861_27060 [Mesorhizobium sp. M8A.F.Ca.ET.218.01.1.1]TGT16082.1 hypothetical protein EN856_26595 [Mesorhizobium sp. M8A.F.Ca.ET.213.01.1.1]